eukprot:CCRYP_016439-RA/>CCRYP_016439-RA protein AED:0.42 eAED:0.50 QI:0/0/0/1/0/0/2/0/281
MGQPLFSTGTAPLNLPTLPPVIRHGHIVPGLTHNLISISTLCDAACTACFTANPTTTVILSGTRDMHAPRLWPINLEPLQHSLALHIVRPHTPLLHQQGHNHLLYTIRRPQLKPCSLFTMLSYQPPPAFIHTCASMTSIAFLHATAGYPVKSTWLQAIKSRSCSSWPGIAYTLVAKYCLNPDTTIQGHLAQSPQHITSTTRATARPPALPAIPQQAIDLFTIPLNKILTNDTGCFHPQACSGNQYIMSAPSPASMMSTTLPHIKTSILAYPMPTASPGFMS